jgi:FMN phosphatase YigB (HAD superfamily)
MSWVREHFDMVIFDLDDTLCPIGPQLTPAFEKLSAVVKEKMPLSAAAIAASLREAMQRIAKHEPLIAHDLTEIRRRALLEFATPHGEHEHVEGAMQQFLEVSIC